MTEIIPSILSADMARLADAIDTVKAGGAAMIHVDVMDGHFVPNITIGPPVVASLRKATDLVLDVHLMIEDPDRYITDFIKAGADQVSVHQEAVVHLDRSIQLIRSSGAAAGVAINPATPIETLSEVFGILDYVLVMSVNPGFGGQSFIPYALQKIQRLDQIRRDRGLDFRIEVDGGVTSQNVCDVVRAGADWVVAGSSVYHSKQPRAAFEDLRRAAQEATLSRI
ncbi:MAG: ribulose-phosphate 3-epimerase [Acidobacteria bacterium RIFCSPLOWO2_12_FULL_54_10]|nr:MAG: ribulose-phosphate 3-epimerase [Acidobacteria bacterium RIFCSPLOWO2_12_FULL_54_10]